MLKKSKILTFIVTFLLLTLFSFQSVFAASNVTLKKGMRGAEVTSLQKDLQTLGFMDYDATGYFGSITKTSVINFQKKNGLMVDGIAGSQTLGKLDSLLDRTATVSRGAEERTGQVIADYAKKLLGIKYVWGGTSTKGFDCSGFVKYVFAKMGITLSRVSSSQAKNGTYIKKSNILPGDAVFFDTNGGNNYINHVGIYIGGGKFIHSSSSHSGVVISDLNEGFYSNAYMTARRMID